MKISHTHHTSSIISTFRSSIFARHKFLRFCSLKLRFPTYYCRYLVCIYPTNDILSSVFWLQFPFSYPLNTHQYFWHNTISTRKFMREWSLPFVGNRHASSICSCNSILWYVILSYCKTQQFRIWNLWNINRSQS